MNNILKDAQTFEASRLDSLVKSERRAWTVASVAVGLCVLGIAAHYTLPPRVETQPYMVRVDNVTGMVDVVTVMDDQTVTGNEALDKSHLARYVTARESYNWYTLQKDYDNVGLMSSDDIGADYAALWSGENARQDQYRDRVTVDVDLISVVPNSDGIGTVRFITRTTRNNVVSKASYVATIGYTYRNTSRMVESVRLANPMGFTVLSYRVDAEIVGAGL